MAGLLLDAPDLRELRNCGALRRGAAGRSTDLGSTKRSPFLFQAAAEKSRQGMEGNTSAPAAGGRPPLGTLPVLVYDHGVDHNQQTAFAIGDQSLHTSVVPELANSYYHVTPQGWVLLVAPGPSPATRLWDPRSGTSISLPPKDDELPDNWKCYLSDAPTAASCVVLVLYMNKEPKFLYCRVGDGRWLEHEYDIGEVMQPPVPFTFHKRVIQEMAVVDGKFYFQERGLEAIDFSTGTPEFSRLEYRRVEFPEGSNICRDYMVESGGDLFFVYVFLKGYTPEIMTVRVYRFDLSEAMLREVDDLGDRVFLLSYPNAQLLCSASKYRLKGNQIYFVHNATQDLDGGSMCIYDMDDKSLDVVRPFPQVKELLRSPFWMLPTDQVCTRE
ncbi:hypothetical protein HU200_054958 [Digitaria exilis]|uniref:KIB1-4 beta-propeller domain-containing protein n=1 Tax=Digitaria exilis TaxID=1010633 RepID=A0A835AU20_9POAL|nr:hypothetical protein HU200_054958 [Digitaria exilis]